ncbi:MAG TPA: DUF4331 family protein [Thermoanaerobaculia bacterium]|jgi:hypothetical protein|nr:DUF4331 family protein [Thermoanaerobaculia bacterium]
MQRLTTLALAGCLLAAAVPLHAADHNDPNSVNSIFSDVPVSAADLYDMFGWPADDKSHGENVVLALTFASVPRAGVLDTDMLYRIRIKASPRVAHNEVVDLVSFLKYADAVTKRYVTVNPEEIRVTVNEAQQAKLTFIGFPGGSFSQTIATNQTVTVTAPDGSALKLFVGGRDDAFFNDLPGFFRSINYAPQFYHVPLAMADMRELKIPKTLLELEGNTLFNYDPDNPKLGSGVKKDLPPGPYTWNGKQFHKDANGNYRFVYSGKDAQAGKNVNAVVVEAPLTFITKSPRRDRIVNSWGESWVLKASSKIETIPDNPPRSIFGRIAAWFRRLFHRPDDLSRELGNYKLVDTDGVPFADAALSEREDNRQLGANNLALARHFVTRLGHLGWGFGPSISALGLGTCFDHGNSPVSVYKTYTLATEAFPRAKKCLFQQLNMPDNSWNKSGIDISLKRPFEIFIPNVEAIDMDTNGTWPFGRRLEDQVATRFLSVFLDHQAGCGGKPCNVESLSDQALWDKAPIEPKTPPNPLHNDKPFLTEFPYLASPW